MTKKREKSLPGDDGRQRLGALPSDEPSCACGHVRDEHSRTGECQVEGCPCACYETEKEG